VLRPVTQSEQIGVIAIEQGFESVQLHGAELIGGPFGERAEDQVDFLCPAMPAAKQQALAADLGVVASHSGSSTDITHDYPPSVRRHGHHVVVEIGYDPN
jgi:hypothetical protein